MAWLVDKISPSHFSDSAEDIKEIEGYKMELIDKKEATSQMTSSGIQLAAVLIVLAVNGLFAFFVRKKIY